MMGKRCALILCVNPGSTSTKLALFEEEECLWKLNLDLTDGNLAEFSCNNDSIPFRIKQIEQALADHGVRLEEISAFSGRGGGQASHIGGTYEVNALMVQQAHDEIFSSHPANLACQICYQLSLQTGKPAFMTNSPATDEMRQVARLLGIAGKYRNCYAHALNQKETAKHVADDFGRPYEELNLIVCHIGGGVSVTAHQKGRMVDTNDNLNGDGPMAPTRTGSIPAVDMIEYAFDAMERGETRQSATRFVRSKGGLVDLLGTYDAREIVKRIEEGDIYAKNVYDAFIYQIAKYIGAMYVALEGHCDAIVLTGGIAHDKYLTQGIRRWVEKIAPIKVVAGEFEMEALAHGALHALEHGPLAYTGIPVWSPERLHECKEE